MTKEPEITINGTNLSDGEAMTLRVALDAFAMELRQDWLGADEHGKLLTKAYLGNLETIRNLIFKVS